MQDTHVNQPSGVGLGLRFDHFDEILAARPTNWFEVIADDFLTPGPHHDKLTTIAETSPLVFHSVGMNLGGVDPLDETYLKRMVELHARYNPAWVSDHLCWTAHAGHHHHDLLPFPKTKEALHNVANRIKQVQDILGRQLAVENITSYIDFRDEEYSEGEFLTALVERTGCALLLDVSNIMINHRNRKHDPATYFADYPLNAVVQVHLAGGTIEEDVEIDAHTSSVHHQDIEMVASLYARGLNAPVMIERDANIPPFADLEAERRVVQEMLNETR